MYSLSLSHKLRRFEIGFHPIHGLLSDGSAKLSSNISFDMLPLSQKPTSFATISALSWICLPSWGSIQSLFTNCILLCFPSSGTSHFMYNASLSSALKREVTLLARNSLSRFSARILHEIKIQNIFIILNYQGIISTSFQAKKRRERSRTLMTKRLLARLPHEEQG